MESKMHVTDCHLLTLIIQPLTWLISCRERAPVVDVAHDRGQIVFC